MQASRIEMFPLFRSTDLTKATVELFLSEEELSISDLARRVGATRVAISKAVPDLVRAGIVSKRSVGRTTMLSANTEAPFYWPLRQLLEITQGVPKVLEDEFREVGGIDSIHVYGSWAARFNGTPGLLPGDIDVVVVTDVSDRSELYLACERASVRLKREVNALPCSLSDWASASDAFIASIKAAPLVAVNHVKVELSNAQSSQPGSDSSHSDGGWAQALLS